MGYFYLQQEGPPYSGDPCYHAWLDIWPTRKPLATSPSGPQAPCLTLEFVSQAAYHFEGQWLRRTLNENLKWALRPLSPQALSPLGEDEFCRPLCYPPPNWLLLEASPQVTALAARLARRVQSTWPQLGLQSDCHLYRWYRCLLHFAYRELECREGNLVLRRPETRAARRARKEPA